MLFAFALANLLQKANSGSSWRLTSEKFGGTECSFVYHAPGPRGISPGYFCLSRAPVFLATPHHGHLRPEGHGDLQGGLRDERSIKSHHIYVPNGLRPPFFALYYPHYHHIFVYPFFNSVPGRGSVSTADERRQCSIIVYGDLLWNALVVERASNSNSNSN